MNEARVATRVDLAACLKRMLRLALGEAELSSAVGPMVMIAALVYMGLVATPATAADAPEWALNAAATTVRPADSGADGVVLLDSLLVTVAADGQVTTRRQYAILLRTAAGARDVEVREAY